MKQSILVEWESESPLPTPVQLFAALGAVAGILPGFPQDIAITYNGATVQRAGGQWVDQPSTASVDSGAEPGPKDVDRGRRVASILPFGDLLILGVRLGLLDRGEVKTVRIGDILDLLFSRASERGHMARLVCAVLETQGERP